MNKTVKILFFTSLLLLMFFTTVWASMQQNLFTEFSLSGSPMWFIATLVDFYINQIIIWIASCFFVKSNIARFIWLVVFVTLGSMGTCAFIIIRLFQNKSLLNLGKAKEIA